MDNTPKLFSLFPIIVAIKLDFILLIVENVLLAVAVEMGIFNKTVIMCCNSSDDEKLAKSLKYQYYF